MQAGDINVDAYFDCIIWLQTHDYNITLPSTHPIQASPYPLFRHNFIMETSIFNKFYVNAIHKDWKHYLISQALQLLSDHSAKKRPYIYVPCATHNRTM